MNGIFLCTFWVGALLLINHEKWDLKKRSEFYLGKISASAKLSEPYKAWKKFLASKKKDKMLAELAQSLAYIKNITVLGRGRSISAVMLLEELSDMFPSLSKVYINMARYLSVNEKDNAKEALYIEMGVSYARDIGSFLAGWEDIPQDELLSSIDAYSRALRDERATRIKKRDELISDLVYFPVVINCMAVLLNFIYVAYFIEQKEALMGLF